LNQGTLTNCYFRGQQDSVYNEFSILGIV